MNVKSTLWPNTTSRYSYLFVRFVTVLLFIYTSPHHVFSYREQCEQPRLDGVRDVAFPQRSPRVRPRELPGGDAAVPEAALLQLTQLPAHVSEEEASSEERAA